MARRGRGSGGFLLNGIWAIFILSCIFAFFQTPVPANTNGAIEYLKAKSASTEAWVKSFTDGGNVDLSKLFKGSGGLTVNIDGKLKELGGDGKSLNDILGGFTDGTNGNKESKDIKKLSSNDIKKVSSSLDKLKVEEEQKVAYDRKQWNHWVAPKGSPSCWNTREEVLAKQGSKIVYLDSNKKETKTKSKACSIKSGEWNDVYTGKKITDPSKIDIDHMIPLSYAAKHGGQAWDSAKKKDYANSLKTPYHLLAVDAGANRAKGDKGPGDWMPSNKAYQCNYVANWVAVSGEWGLTISKSDVAVIKKTLKSC